MFAKYFEYYTINTWGELLWTRCSVLSMSLLRTSYDIISFD